MTHDEAVDAMKDFADRLRVEKLISVRRVGEGCWERVTVSHASLLSDSEDGWDVEVARVEL